MERLHAFAFYMGYAEDQCIAPVLMVHEEGFETVAQAILSIREVGEELAREHAEYSRPRSKCIKSKCPKDTTNFCSMCGDSLQTVDEEILGEEISAYLSEEFTFTINDAHDSLLLLGEKGWDLFPVPDLKSVPGPWTICGGLDRIITDAEPTEESVQEKFELYN